MLFQEIASPWNSAKQMALMQDRLNGLFSNLPVARRNEFPPINVWASSERAVIVAEVPGIDPDCIDVQIVNDTLTLKTKRDPDTLEEDQTWHRRERGYGQFCRTLEFPYAIDAEKVQASFSQGILKIELTRAAEDLPKKISIQAS